ncbi:MAG: sulfurtransferase [Elusimicrobia bacterium]|nr:sulfurtransferase [Elusimicrobiota bacterium]
MSTAPSPRFDAYVGQTKTRVRQVSVPWLHERMERKDVYFVIDVREDSEWTQGHVPGAFHISKGVLERFIEALAPDTGQEIIVYCNTGSRSALAADSLQRMGYSNILSVDGGFRAWVVAGYPTE